MCLFPSLEFGLSQKPNLVITWTIIYCMSNRARYIEWIGKPGGVRLIHGQQYIVCEIKPGAFDGLMNPEGSAVFEMRSIGVYVFIPIVCTDTVRVWFVSET